MFHFKSNKKKNLPSVFISKFIHRQCGRKDEYKMGASVSIQAVDESMASWSFCLVELKQLLCKLLEPNPSHRLPLMDVEIHPWVTCDAKMPFYPFHAFPRDKLLKSQVSYHSRDVWLNFYIMPWNQNWGGGWESWILLRVHKSEVEAWWHQVEHFVVSGIPLVFCLLCTHPHV